MVAESGRAVMGASAERRCVESMSSAGFVYTKAGGE